MTKLIDYVHRLPGEDLVDRAEYVLQNCGKDEMRICVLTGPIFSQDDPVMQSVKVPLTFWKLVASINAELVSYQLPSTSVPRQRKLEN